MVTDRDGDDARHGSEEHDMTIDVKEKATKEFYKEFINISNQRVAYLVEPEAKVSDSFTSSAIMMGGMLIIFALELYRGIRVGFAGMTNAVLVFALLAFIVLLIYTVNQNKKLRSYMNDTARTIVTLDENGIEQSRDGIQVARAAWEDVALVRSFSESTCFFEKDKGEVSGSLIAVPNAYKKEVLAYLVDNDIVVKVK